MSQSTVLVGVLLGAFVVYLAMGNRLNAYWSILTGSAAGSAIPPGATSPMGGGPLLPGSTGTAAPPSNFLTNPWGSILKGSPLCWLGGSGC
jgi:hypothetical protein